MARFDFSLEDYEAPQDFEIIPEGTEVCMKALEAESVETSSGGEMIKASFVITEPAEYRNRRVWTNFNIVNSSEKAQNFGRRMLAGWAQACGKPNAKDTGQLLEKEFWCKLGVEKGTGRYKDKNVISSYLMPEGVAESAPKPATGVAVPESTSTEAPAKAAPAKSEQKPSDGGKSNRKNPWDD